MAVTGASGGLGAALAVRIATQSSGVVLMARRSAMLEEVAGRCGDRALTVVADVTDRDQVDAAVASALTRFGRIDVWVNNVGRGITRMPSELTDGDIDSMMLVNVKSALYGIQAVLPHMKERGTGQIVNISSILGRIPASLPRAAYNGAKHFLNSLTANLRDELAEDFPGITVSLVSPGLVWTEFGANALHGGPLSTDLGNGQLADEVADVIADVIANRRSDVYTRGGSKPQVSEYFDGLGEDP